MNDPILIKMLVALGWVFSVLFAAGVSFALARVGANRDRKSQKVLTAETVAIAEVKTRDARISQLEKDVQSLEAKAQAQEKAAIPITAAMEAMLIAKLVNDHLPAADALLKKQSDHTLTPEDAIEFAKKLKEREADEDPRIGEAQQIAARVLPDVIRLRQLAEEAGSDDLKTIMVSVPSTDTIAAPDGGTQEKEKDN